MPTCGPRTPRWPSTPCATSLEQVLDVASGRPGGSAFPHTPAAPRGAGRFRRLPQQQAAASRSGLARAARARFAFSRRRWPRRPCRASGPASARCRAFAARWACSSGLPGPSTCARVDGGFVASQSQRGAHGGARPVVPRRLRTGRRDGRGGRRPGLRVDRLALATRRREIAFNDNTAGLRRRQPVRRDPRAHRHCRCASGCRSI